MEDKQNPEKLKKIVEKLYEDALAGDKKAIDVMIANAKPVTNNNLMMRGKRARDRA